MGSTSTSRRFGVNASAAVKVPCLAATTANITLSGEQTIDGVACVTGDRVLVKDQTTGSENGIYLVDTGNWSREPDWDGTYDVQQGTLVRVVQGSANQGVWGVTTSGTITIDTTDVVFELVFPGTVSPAVAATLSRTTLADFVSTLVGGVDIDYPLRYDATYATPTTFTTSGDATNQFSKNRKVQLTDASTLTDTVLSSSYSAATGLTTVTLAEGGLSAALTVAALSIIDPTAGAIPFFFADPLDPQFGAIGDGVTDDYAALEKAVLFLDSLGGGTLLLREGYIYGVSQAVPFRSRIRYLGCGGRPTIKALAASTDNVVGEATPAAAYSLIAMENLEIDGNRANVSFNTNDAYGNGIRLNQVSMSVFRDLYIHDTMFNGISNYNISSDNTFINPIIRDIGKTGTAPGASSYSGIFIEFGCDRVKIIVPDIIGCRTYGIWETGNGADNYDNEIISPLISTCYDGIRIGDETGSNIQHAPKVIGGSVRNCTSQAVRVYHAGTGTIDDTLIQGVYGTSNANGIAITSGGNRTKLLGNTMVSNTGTGLSIGSGATDTMLGGNIGLSNGTNYTDSGTRTVDLGNITDATGVFQSNSIIRSLQQLEVSVAAGNDAQLRLDQSGVGTWYAKNVKTSGYFVLEDAAGNQPFLLGTNAVGFYSTVPSTQQAITGSRSGNAALDSLLTALGTLGLVTNNTTT